MTLLKSTERKQHETVAVLIAYPIGSVHDKDTITTTILFERRRRRPHQRNGHSPFGHALASFMALLPQYLHSSGLGVDTSAKDHIILLPKSYPRHITWKEAVTMAYGEGASFRHMYTITYADTKPTVLDLAIMLRQVTDTRPDYTIHDSCYLYAALACESLRITFRGRKTWNALTKSDSFMPGASQ
uniref:Uncharacterized protein n=1 Tax=Moniliophthora roreri TaxID=221103 RepID=A0A0W0G536_MONRR